ncbi:LuxR C-terminal-related transcriptional regulator [Eggerthella sinensis]|uniref:LuxR C-terminal-related transcriptional regulator n=1 Tax=Eggerthella sinensis TaxID=242230 RepID=UPI00266B83AA|nr:LuxR C-terminal-related transcriptional regulator [Eggerthella sinensis]
MSEAKGTVGLRASTVAMAVGFFVWYTCSNWVSALTYDVSFSYWWLNKSGAVVVATLLMCAVLWRVDVGARLGHVLDGVFAAVYACALLVLLAGTQRAGMQPWADVLGLMLFALAQTWMVVRWGSRYTRSSTDEVARALLLAIVLVAAAKCVTTFLPEPATMVLMVALPFLSMGMLALSRREPLVGRSSEVWFSRGSLASFARIVAAMAVFFFIWSILNMTLKHGTGHYSFGAAATPAYTLLSQLILFAFCAFVYWWVFQRRRHLDITVVWRFTYVLMALALFMLVSFGMAQFIQAFTGAAVVVAKMFLWLALANVAHHGAFRSFMVFCPGMLLYSLPDWLGRSAVSFLGLESLNPAIASFLLVVSVVMVAFFLPSRSPDVQLLLSDLNGTGQRAIGEGDGIDERCASVGEEHGLSPREIEIMQYLCKGRSRPYIAETLYLSENTVRTHSRRIYGKLDVHNKQELLDLVRGE